MKTRNIIIFAVLCLVLAIPQTARAEYVTFSDSYYAWPGWTNGTSDDTKDTIGTPNFLGGSATIENQFLNNLTFTRQASTYYGDWALSAGDLFIDIDANQTWDYAVDLTSWTTSGALNPDPAAGSYNLFAVNVALNDGSGYIFSGADNTGGWTGFGMRDRHPVALKNVPGAAVGTVSFSGWYDASTQYSFDFSGLNLGSSGEFIVGWMPNCANDVVYEKIGYNVVPEPASMLLFATGLAGAFFRRKIGA